MDKLEDLESFLKSVDKISELVMDLQSADVEVQEKAMEKADCYIAALDEPCRTKVNKTTINTNPPLQPSLSLQNESPESFMKIMERDAEDRRVKRIAKAKKATALKDKGNEAYAREDYETAVKYYSDGLAELRDMLPLYTNRAQAYIKLGKYKEAISDCEWALKCDERCIKAYLHKGKAYLALKKYNEARNSFEKLVEIEPGREKIVKEYLTQVDLEEERESQEMNAMQKFDKGDGKAIAVPQLLEKLSRPDQMPFYYCGGFEILSQAVTDCTGQTLFRLNNGFSIISSNDMVRRLVRNLMASISKPQQQQENTAVNILKNFTTENKLCVQLRDELTDSVLMPFSTILGNISKSNQHVLPSLISAVGGLARDNIIRHNFAHDPECWRAFLVAIKQCRACGYTEVLYLMLGLIINLSTITSPVIQEHAVSLCDCCMGLLRDSDGGVVTRATGVLSTVLPQSSEAIQHVILLDVVRTMRWLLKGTGETATKYAIKTLTVCTAASHLAREELLKSDKKLSVLRRLLGSSCDEMVSGNAALCLAHCLELEGIASNLLGTDIVPLLLRHAAGDAKRTAVQQNAAIALGKLCRSEPRHIKKLRELHGLEVLHSCVKLIT
ncbi:tetratricopeptide repeat protein 12 isoform X2 [Chaetodon auriga]|uniref:tetratricopeptide repeat protein 12 isoform X2 n=1 Tax=Chaetodon auriga TaxID=39042 RepID=UPI004032FA65